MSRVTRIGLWKYLPRSCSPVGRVSSGVRTSPQTRSQLLPLTAAIVALSCAPRHVPPPVETPAPSLCLIADTTASTPDTIRVIGAMSRSPAGVDCQLQPFQAADTPAVVVLAPPTGADLRDVLEGRLQHMGIPQPDVVVSRDPDLLDFARRKAGYLAQSLPWSTTYVLVTAGLHTAPSLPSDAEREAIARNAITADTRGAMGSFGWLTEPACAYVLLNAPGAPLPIVAYLTGDAIARQVAERIVSLSAASSRPAWLPIVRSRTATTGPRVAPLPFDSILTALTTSRAAAAVIPIARDWTTTCGTRDNVSLPHGAIPLVDARDHIIIRRGSGAAVLIGANGTLHFVKRGTR